MLAQFSNVLPATTHTTSPNSPDHTIPLKHQLYAVTTFATMIGIPVSALTTTWCDPPRISNAHALPAPKGRPITNINQE